MPTYEYECKACGHVFEEFQSITANPLRRCPACQRLKLQRLIGAGAGIIFKGSGFYETDYRSEEYKKKAQAEKSAAETKPSTGKDSKKEKTPPSDGSSKKKGSSKVKAA